ncbi:hypothetical protein N9O16_05340 [Candidatus Poseidoniaceae archaeon]|nr:hypothetical protein [Euryarchaeota archaeon]MDA8805086.1 hypothetical protein [Euryarchaeota archaeon]MDA9166893.1 hypothetical protein [Candidatus Poseidoniaceae archaeon]
MIHLEVIHLREHTSRQTLLAAILVALFVLPMYLPLANADDTEEKNTASGRAILDFYFRNPLQLSNSGSAVIGSSLFLEPGEHIVTANISATGSGSDDLWLVLQHKGSPSLGFTDVKSIAMGTVSGASGQVDLTSISFSWNATNGAGQELRIKIVSTKETGNDLLNNIQDVGFSFSVENKHLGELMTNTFPADSPVTNQITLPNAVSTLNTTVTNSGVKPISATMTIVLRDNSTPANVITVPSNTVLLQPGSYPASSATLQESGVLSADVDAQALTGVWNISASVKFDGTSWTETVIVRESWVKFSDYNAIVIEPATLVVEPGDATALTFVVKNTGSVTDLFTISVTQNKPWADINSASFGATLPAGSIRLITLDINVPANAVRSETDKITMTFTSVNSPDNYQISGVGRVMVGDFFKGEVTLIEDATTKTINPGGQAQYIAQIENTGSVTTTYTLTTGLSVSTLNWTWEVSPSITPPVASGATTQVVVTLTAPAIQNPIVTSEYNMAGDQLDVWIQCQPIGGGVPSQDTAPIEVSPVIVVDPGLNSEPQHVPVEVIEQTLTGTQLVENIDLNLRVIHNLPTLLTETLDATLTTSKSFTALNEGGFGEADRWSVSVSNPIYTGLTPGDSMNTTLDIIGPQANQYPVAGTFSASLTITPTLSPALVGSGVTAVTLTRNYTLVIPQVINGDFLDSGPYDIPVGVDNSIPMRFANTGNDVGSYRLRVVDNLPENWSANFTDADQNISNLSADIADGTLDGSSGNAAHIQVVSFNIRTDPLAPAGLNQPITVRIEDPVSGLLIGTEHVFFVVVGQIFNGSLTPTNQSLELDIADSTFTSITVVNTGNAPTDYEIWLDNSLAGDVDFQIESPSSSSLFIAAGYEETIRVEMNANDDADSDGFYMTTVWVSANNGQILLSANIVANITENHSIAITAPEQMAVTPGQMEQVEFGIVNLGNLQETVGINLTVEGNISLSKYQLTETIPIDQTYSDSVNIAIPSLGGTDTLVQGSVYNLTITAINSTTGIVYSSHTVELLIQPLFIVESTDWPSVMEFQPKSTRTWEVTLTNTGNKDVTVNAVYAITRPGLTNLSTDWEMITQPSLIVLPRNIPVVHTFTAVGTVNQPLLSLTADLTLFLDPTETEVEGSGEFKTQLIMSRFFSTGDIGIEPDINSDVVDVFLPYTNIPTGNGSEVAYMIELCDSERLLDLGAMGLSEFEYSWNFTLIVDKFDGTSDEHPLNLEQECGAASLGPTSRYNLLELEAWNPSSIRIQAEIPTKGFILPGDGWDLTFRLYHPDENNGYTVYDEETFALVLAVFADPMIKSISSNDGRFQEGTESTITVVVQNVGSATALDVMVDLQCEGLTVSSDPLNRPVLLNRSVSSGLNYSMIPFFFATQERTLTWVVAADSIDWWSQRSEATCVATLNASFMENNVEENDQMTLKEDVISWSPGVSSSFVAAITCLLVSMILFRLTSQNDNFRLLAIYAGVIGFGFSFHVFQFAWWGFVVLTLAALWIWRMTWKSTDEFRLLHEDYQRARRGISTLYADHFEELASSRRQLRTILGMPVLGMLAIILGLPPMLAEDQTNVVSIAAYVIVVMAGVWYLINRANNMYGALYGRLTDIEVKAVRIERDLGDPARLFNELAGDGLNLDDIFGAVEASQPLTPENLFSNEEVNDDA